MLIFYNRNYDIDYMGFRCYVGLWVTLFLLIITVTDLSFLVKYITRFTGIYFKNISKKFKFKFDLLKKRNYLQF
jgi:hypothetical protein